MTEPPNIGRQARRPTSIPARGWGEVVARVWRRVGRDNLGLISAGVAFYALLALFPAVAGMLALYGLVFDPSEAARQLDYFRGLLPADAFDLISSQFTDMAAGSARTHGTGVAVAVMVSLWSAAKGSRSLITALNVAYDERERRSLVGRNLAAFTLTAFLIVLGAIGLAVIVLIPLTLAWVGLSAWSGWLMAWLRWPLVAFVALFALAWIYRYGPARRNARWKWVTPGALLAVALWVMASALFSFYVAHFAKYNVTYGSVGAVVILLMWFYLSAFAIILGAELNAELERQTARDTTWHGEQPMGRRGAYVADHLPGASASSADERR